MSWLYRTTCLQFQQMSSHQRAFHDVCIMSGGRKGAVFLAERDAEEENAAVFLHPDSSTVLLILCLL